MTSSNGWEQTSYAYPCGVELFQQGQSLPEALYVVSGTVKLTHVDSEGRESLVALAMANEWLGTAAIIAQRPTPTSAVTCSRTSLRRCPVPTFLRLLEEDRRFSARIHEARAHDLFRQMNRIGELCSHDSRRRLLAVLCRFATVTPSIRNGPAVKLRLPLHQWELAEFIGVTPEHLSRLLKEMERGGIVRRENGWIVIGDVRRPLAEEGHDCTIAEDLQ